MNRYFIFIFSLCFTILASVVQAQSLPSSTGIELSANTDSPTPGQTVTITARSYSADIDAANLTWKENGKEVQKGVGVTVLNVTAPALGKKIIIDVSATTIDGQMMAKSITISSGSVDMIIEHNGYVPQPFKGKVPVVYQNTVKVIAMPHLANSSGVEYDPKTLVYTWKRNSQVIEDQSGYGKQSIQLTGDIVPRALVLTVVVSTRDGSSVTTGYTQVTFDSPTISFYVNDPLYGPLFNKAVTESTRIGSQKETGILSVPFGFIKPSNGIGDLQYTWMINGIERTELADKESVVLRTPDSMSGSSEIRLEIKNKKQFLQSIYGGFSVLFTAGSAKSTESITF